MEKENKLTEAEEKQIKISKMRMIRDIREEEIYNLNSTKSEDEKLNLKVNDVKYLGTIKWVEKIGDEERISDKDIYLEIEEKDGKIINRYYDENANLIAMEREDFGLMISEEFRDISEELIKQIEVIKEERTANKDKVEELSLDSEEKKLANEVLKGKGSKDEEEKENEKEANEEKEEIPEEELKQKVSGIQEVKLNSRIDDRGTQLGNRLNLSGDYTKLVVARTESVREVTDIGGGTDFTILAFNKETGNLEPIPDLQLDGVAGNNVNKETVKINGDRSVDVDNKTKSRYMLGETNTTLSVENGEYGEIKVYMGEKAKNSNEYVETQLETNQVWPTPKEVRDTQDTRKGMYRTDKMAEEAKSHYNEECKEDLQVEDVDGNPNTYSEEHVEELSEKLRCSENEAKRLLDNYVERNPNVPIHDAIDEIEEEENEKFRDPSSREK